MKREDALTELSSNSTHARLKAARFLSRNSEPADVDVLRKALKEETVSYVRTSLNLAIKHAASASSVARAEDVAELEIPGRVRRQIRNEVTQEVAGRFLHEVASRVGLLETATRREIPDFEKSKTRIHIKGLRRTFSAMEQLKEATAVPKIQEVELADLIQEVVTTEVGDRSVDVSLHGTKPFVISTDPCLVALALSNGIRNAVEAMKELGTDEPHAITVTWGETDVDYWIAVIDGGVGIVGPVGVAFDMGNTTKRGHSGFGLPVARQAIETLGGSCSLQSVAEGGTHFEIRWEK